MINEFVTKLDVTEIEANKIYETAMSILSKEIKDKLKHPFRSMINYKIDYKSCFFHDIIEIGK